MFIYFHKKGQSTLEYGVIIAVIVAALVAMQTYVKRGIQGKMRQSADDIGEQFSPGYTTGHSATTTSVSSSETVTGGEQPLTTSSSTQRQTRDTDENVADSTQEDWAR